MTYGVMMSDCSSYCNCQEASGSATFNLCVCKVPVLVSVHVKYKCHVLY